MPSDFFEKKYRELIRDLEVSGAVGLDLSPGDALSRRALAAIKDLLKHLSDTTEGDDEAYEAELLRSFKSGKSAGMSQVANGLMEDALFNYKCGQDVLANEFRVKAKHWAAKAEEEHPGPPK